MLLVRNGALRRMLAAGFVSWLGDRLHQIALAALIMGLTGSLLQASLVFVVSTLPYVLLGMVAGTLVDRWDRRLTMVGADLVRAALVALLPLAAVAGLPLVYGLLFVITCAGILFNPAQQAAVPDVVDAKDLTDANALLQTARYLSDIVGYPLAGTLVAALVASLGALEGTRVVFWLDAASYLVSAALLWRLPAVGRAAGAASAAAGPFWRQVQEGLRFLLRHPEVRTNTILLTLGPLLLGALHTLWVGFAWRVSQTDAFGYGVTELLNGLGALLGLRALHYFTERMNKGRVILLGFALMGVSILAVGLTDRLPIAAVLALLAGVGNMLLLVPSITLVQQQTPSALRGRVFGVRITMTYAAFSVSNAAAGALAEQLGVSTLFLLLGGGMALLAAVAYTRRSAREAA